MMVTVVLKPGLVMAIVMVHHSNMVLIIAVMIMTVVIAQMKNVLVAERLQVMSRKPEHFSHMLKR